MERYSEGPVEDRSKIPKQVVNDGVKWLIVPAKIMLDALSLWPERQNKITALLNCVCVCSYIFFILGNFHSLWERDVDINSMAFSVFLIIVQTEAASRITLLFIYKKQFAKVLSKLYLEFWPSDFMGNGLHRAMAKKTKYLFIYWFIYTASAQWGASLLVIVSCSTGELPYAASYPFSWQQNPYYVFMYIWQSFLLTIQPLSSCALDLLLVSFLFSCIMQFKMLSIYLKRNVKESIQRTEGERGTRAKEIVIYCIKRHNKLIVICKEIDELFTYFILIQYLFTAAALCLALVLATVTHDYAAAFSHMCGHMCEIFIYCYLGNELINEVSMMARQKIIDNFLIKLEYTIGLSNAVYECGWHLTSTDKDLHKSLLMIMIRSQKPLLMSAGGFGYLSLPGFMKIIQFSFSVYTLLKTLMQKQSSGG